MILYALEVAAYNRTEFKWHINETCLFSASNQGTYKIATYKYIIGCPSEVNAIVLNIDRICTPISNVLDYSILEIRTGVNIAKYPIYKLFDRFSRSILKGDQTYIEIQLLFVSKVEFDVSLDMPVYIHVTCNELGI